MKTAVIDTPVGPVEIAEDGGAVVSIRETEDKTVCEPASGLLYEAAVQLREYFAGARREFTFPVYPDGTEFQRKVWNEVRRTPYGTRRSYGDVAQMLGHPGAVRAVASAIGRNPLLFVIPCHRIVASGSLGGFRLGISSKLCLLELEAKP